jgi:hypothetical protein
MRSRWTAGVLASLLAACLLLSSCGGGAGKGINGSAASGPPLVSASLISFPAGSVPAGFVAPTYNTAALVQVQDNSSGAPIIDAAVSVNGVPFAYDAGNQDYEGTLLLAPGGVVNVSVTVAGVTYTQSAVQFSSYPTISAPTSGSTWQSSSANSVTWAGGSPTTNSVYALAVLDSANPLGDLVWPPGNVLQTLPMGTTSFTIGASGVSNGSRLVIVGIATAVGMPSAAVGSSIVIGGFNYVPITVGASPPPPPEQPGPITPPPGLWQPTPGSTPAMGNFVYLQSEAGDYIGAGQTLTFTQANAFISVVTSGARFGISVSGDTSWSGDFQGKSSLSQLQVGYYGGLKRYPFHDPAFGGLNWSGDGRGCNTLQGWFVVDNITYAGTVLTAIDLRFEQHCEGAGPALHGAIHWNANDTTAPPGPVNPPPTGLWQPAPGSTPASGNFVYLESQFGDFVGQGQTYTFTQANATLGVAASSGHLAVNVNGDTQWFGDFQAMQTLTKLEVGFYDGLERYPFHNPAKGGLSWSGDGRGCNTLLGWFVVDSVTYVGSALSAIDLRFEQHCEGGAPALHGAIHWTSADATAPPGPVNPPPAGLWQPAPGSTPATGNFVYLQSDFGDFVGLGQTLTYTQADAVISVSANGGHLGVGIDADTFWTGNFQAMNTLNRLEVGYYGDLQRYPFHNPVKGGLDWSGDGRGCNTETGWFVVDSVTYAGSTLTAIDLRFEQHCEGGAPALHGAIHWTSSDTTAPPGPVNPPPNGLWQPAPGATPASGNYVYLQSDQGDFVGLGQTLLFTPANTTFSVNATGRTFHITLNGSTFWFGDFQAMNTLSLLQPGYYGGLIRYPFNNPTKGGLSWSGDGRGCNELTGWFVIDAVTYSGSTLTSIDLRFEQHCEGGTPALHGAIHWNS